MSSPLANDSADLTAQPVIGVLAQRWVTAVRNDAGKVTGYTQQSFHPHRQYLASSYTKWIEQAGARVVPISFHSTRKELEILFSQLNGILLPGGDSCYEDSPSLKWIIEEAIKINKNGRHFPIWGTCLGFQMIGTHLALNNDDPSDNWKPDPELNQSAPFDFLDQVEVRNQSNPLTWTPESKDSKFVQETPQFILDALSAEPLTANFHNYGITVSNFKKHLSKSCLMLSTAMAETSINKSDEHTIRKEAEDEVIQDPNDANKLIWRRAHVTMFEHRAFPLYAVQFHPERTVFEWGATADGTQGQKISRSRNAVLASQHMATFFAFSARLSPNSFKSLVQMNSKLIYHYPKGHFGVGIVEMYFFDNFFHDHDELSEEEKAFVPYLRYINGVKMTIDGYPAPPTPTSDQADSAQYKSAIVSAIGVDPKTGQVDGESLIAPM